MDANKAEYIQKSNKLQIILLMATYLRVYHMTHP